jgi:membrane dipeptidase
MRREPEGAGKAASPAGEMDDPILIIQQTYERQDKKGTGLMFIVDAHQDIAYNALQWQRDIRASVAETREREAREHPDYALEDAQGGICMAGLPELRRGGFALVFGTLFSFPRTVASQHLNCRYTLTQSHSNADEAWRVARQQLAYYHELAREAGVSLVTSRRDLEHLLKSWSQSRVDDPARPFGIVPLMEGADPVRSPAELEDWFQAGTRLLGISWVHGSRYSGGNEAPGPLTPAGRELVAQMQRLGYILDVSHMAEESFWQVLEAFQGTIIASHSNCRALVNTPRHLSDDMIRALCERGGVIGIALFNRFLSTEWSRQNHLRLSLTHVVAHIDHICQLMGSSAYVGIGSDIDGGFGRDETPEELDTVADLPRLAEALQHAGYGQDDIVRIMGGNWLRLLEQALPPA